MTVCLNDRFAVEVGLGSSGSANGSSSSVDSGYFWFVDEAHIDLTVRVVNACDYWGTYWVFAASVTEIEFELTVTDTATGTSHTYENELGQRFQPITDTSAFVTCP